MAGGAALAGGEANELGVDFFAQVLPDGLRHIAKDAHYGGIKLNALKANDLFAGRPNGLRGAVGTVGGDGIERVSYGKNSGAQWNLFSFELAGISGAIELFLVGVNDLGGLGEEGLQDCLCGRTDDPAAGRYA